MCSNFFANSERIRGKKSLDWNTSRRWSPVLPYPYPLTNSAKELINELRLQFQSTSLRTPLIHRLMKIPGTNSSSNNRRTIKSSLLNRTPLPIHRAIKATSVETAPNLISCYESSGKKKKKKKERKKENKIPVEPRQEVFRVTLDGVGKLLPSQRCLRQRFISSVSASSKKRRQPLPSFYGNDWRTSNRFRVSSKRFRP